MNWLTIDTSTSVLGVGVMTEETVVGQITTNLKRHHSERLLPSIDHLLEETNTRLHDIGGVAVTRGPGSYTGVRIGVTTAKILAWSLNVPLVGVSSLAALAVNGERFPGRLIPMWDARRERVYTAEYCFDAQGQLKRVKADRVISVKEWVDHLAEENRPFLFLGDGSVHYRSLIEAQLGNQALFSAATENSVRPASIGRLAIQKWQRDGSDDIASFAPEYLQATEAESNWEKRNSRS